MQVGGAVRLGIHGDSWEFTCWINRDTEVMWGLAARVGPSAFQGVGPSAFQGVGPTAFQGGQNTIRGISGIFPGLYDYIIF